MIVAAALLLVYALVIERLFNKTKTTTLYSTQYWSHRGFNSAALPENSIAAFEYVKQMGATGIETDVFWQEQQQRFVVSHDAPLKEADSLLTLDQLLARFKDSVSYWIDFKNLTAANRKNAAYALERLAQQYGLEQKLFVESGNGTVLRKLSSNMFKKLYWIQYNRSVPLKWFKLLYIKTLIVCSSFDGYTTGYSLYDEDFKKQFHGLPLYLFDAPATTIREETKEPSFIKVFLADADFFTKPLTP